MADEDLRYVTYKCACGAEDTDKLLPNESMKAAIHCTECKSGQGTQSQQEMVARGVGMRPIVVKDHKGKVIQQLAA